MNKKVKKEAIKWISERIKCCEKDIKNLKNSLINLDKEKCYFRVNLESMWKDIGEKGISYNSSPSDSLMKAIKDADKLFMKENNRGDVQAWRFTYLIVPNDDLTVPDNLRHESIFITSPVPEKQKTKNKA